MAQQSDFSITPSPVTIPRNNRGWIYAIRWGETVKVGRTADRKLRRLREAQTWCPGEIDEIIVKPFWNIARPERSLHTALAEHSEHGEWFKFSHPYWLNFFLDGLRQFRDGEEFRDANSIDFPSWMRRSNCAEIIAARYRHRMTLRKWLQCRAAPWTSLSRCSVRRGDASRCTGRMVAAAQGGCRTGVARRRQSQHENAVTALPPAKSAPAL